MATVYMTRHLIDDIEIAAKNITTTYLHKAEAYKPDNSWGVRIYETIFADALPIVAQLPDKWFVHFDRIVIDRIADQACGISFTLDKPRPWPYVVKKTDLAYSAYDHTYPHVCLTKHPVWDDFSKEVAEYFRQQEKADAIQLRFVRSVRKLCESYKTLPQALRAWPPLWQLVPQYIKDKHGEFRVRGKAEQLPDVDIEMMTTIITAAKLGV